MFRKNSLEFAALLTIAISFVTSFSSSIAALAAAPPRIEKDPVAYFRYLQTSADPPAVALRKRIENGPADLASAQAAALKEGLILDPAKMQRPLPPEGQNAAPLYAKLAKLLKDKPLNLPLYAQPLAADQTYTPEQITIVKRIYDGRPEVWALVHQAADAPQCVVVRDWANKEGFVAPDLPTYREAERLLRTETYLLAAQGNYTDAVKNQARGLRIAGQAAADPTLINYLVGVACEALALNGMRDVLTLAGPNAEVAAEVRQAIEANRPHLSLRYGLIGEPAMLQIDFKTVRTNLAQYGMTGLAASLSPLFGRNTSAADLQAASPADAKFAQDWMDASVALFLRKMCLLVHESDLKLFERRAAFALPSEAAPTALSVLQNITLPAYGGMADQPARLSAHEAVVLAGAAVMGLWTKERGFPETLPATYTDPFTYKPLGYRREGANGFVVYSAGPDGAFDGGKRGMKMLPGQIAFRYPVTNRGALK